MRKRGRRAMRKRMKVGRKKKKSVIGREQGKGESGPLERGTRERLGMRRK